LLFIVVIIVVIIRFKKKRQKKNKKAQDDARNEWRATNDTLSPPPGYQPSYSAKEKGYAYQNSHLFLRNNTLDNYQWLNVVQCITILKGSGASGSNSRS
jgi:hypothetical protein